MTRHALHLRHSQGLAVRGLDKLVIDRWYLRVHFNLPVDGRPPTASAVRARLAGIGYIGFKGADALRRGLAPLSALKPDTSGARRHLEGPQLAFYYPNDDFWPKDGYALWYASDSGVIPYHHQQYNLFNFLLDLSELGRQGIQINTDGRV